MLARDVQLKGLVGTVSKCETRVMAIAIDGGLPDFSPDGLPGQATQVRYAGRRKRNCLAPAPVPGDYSAANVATNHLLPPVTFSTTESAAPPENET